MNNYNVKVLEDLVNKVDNADCEYFIANNVYYAQDIYVLNNEKAFDKDSDKKGIIMFINPCNLANWAHECYFCFINRKETFYSERMWPRKDIENFKIIDINEVIKTLKGY